jgi:hypothetical protein
VERDDDVEVDAVWAMASSMAGMLAVGLAMKIMTRSWAKARGRVPSDPVRTETSWGEATAWAVSTGVVMGVARLAAQRGVAAFFQRRRTA